MNKSKIFVGTKLLAGVFCLGARVVFAQTAAQIEAAKDILAKVPAAELASKSAELVANAPAKQRAAVLMHKYEEMEYSQIAAVLSCSESAVKSLLFRAYESLRARLAHMA